MRSISALVIALAVASPAFADPALVTANLNLREGPGTGFSVLGTIPNGSQVDIVDCDSGATWCAVTWDNLNGFVNGSYLTQEGVDKPAWPRTYTSDAGASLTLYQPQITDWKDYQVIQAMIAAEVKVSKDADPQYGVITFQADTAADDATGEVTLTNAQITNLNFSTLDKNALEKLSLAVNKLVPTEPLKISQERLAASLADYTRLDNVSDLKADAPPIFVSETPAILVMTDGAAVIAPVKGAAGLSFVVNTNWDLLQTDDDKTFYLLDDTHWLTATSFDGDWVSPGTLPKILASLPDDDDWKAAHAAALDPQPYDEGKAPHVYYSDKPAELIIFDGKPKLEPVRGTELQWASNSTDDVFFDAGSNAWYVLLSGRWFSASDLNGPWTFATPDLPSAFLNLPDDQPYSTARASIPGTSENAEARLRARIPQKAKVLTDGSVKVDVGYAGDPTFADIEGTSMQYAQNSNQTVIKVGDQYYVLENGIWFVGPSPTGPFAVATTVPQVIYTIPPASPVYYATYVNPCGTAPGAVYYCYTLGYLGAYLAWDTLVWGTGWYYPPYWYNNWRTPWYPYFPRPVTYGMAAYYNPALGVYGRYGYAYGPYRGIAGGAAYNPRTGTYIRGGVVYGPAGARGFVSAWNPRTDTAVFARGGSDVYGRWGSASVIHDGNFGRVSGGATAQAGGLRWTRSENSGFVAGRRNGDIYAGRDGNVYRRNDGQWEKRGDNGWQPVTRPSAERLQQRGQQLATRNPEAAQRIQSRDARVQPANRGQAPDHLAIDRSGRLAGNRAELAGQYRRRELGAVDGGGFSGGSFRGGGGFSGGGGFRGRR